PFIAPTPHGLVSATSWFSARRETGALPNCGGSRRNAPRMGARQETQSDTLSNAEIADRLAGLAQLLSTQKENPYKVKAYHRAAAKIRSLSESLDELVREDADLTQFPGIGGAIAGAIREIVLTGSLRKLE